jgi:hypothetical protein
VDEADAVPDAFGADDADGLLDMALRSSDLAGPGHNSPECRMTWAFGVLGAQTAGHAHPQAVAARRAVPVLGPGEADRDGIKNSYACRPAVHG